jgi:RNA-directed DNA polymerase
MLLRYADDLVVLCASRARAEEAHRRVAASLAKVGLVLHPDMTRIVCLTRGAEGFEFLGFHHHKVESWKRRGRFHLQRWPTAKAMASIRTKVWEVTHRRFLDQAVGDIVIVVNRVLCGWGAYFRWGNSAAKFGRRGRNWASRYDGRWLRALACTA